MLGRNRASCFSFLAELQVLSDLRAGGFRDKGGCREGAVRLGEMAREWDRLGGAVAEWGARRRG